MAENSIELLGQKFSYPTTWQGALTVLAVCASVSLTAVLLTPEQIDSFGGALEVFQNNQAQADLLALNDKLTTENNHLKDEIRRLTENPRINEDERREIISRVETSEQALIDAYSQVIDKQANTRQALTTAIPAATEQQQRILTSQQGQVDNLISRLEIQQQQISVPRR